MHKLSMLLCNKEGLEKIGANLNLDEISTQVKKKILEESCLDENSNGHCKYLSRPVSGE